MNRCPACTVIHVYSISYIPLIRHKGGRSLARDHCEGTTSSPNKTPVTIPPTATAPTVLTVATVAAVVSLRLLAVVLSSTTVPVALAALISVIRS